MCLYLLIEKSSMLIEPVVFKLLLIFSKWIAGLQDRIEKLAKDLYDDFVKRLKGEPVLGLCVLKGGYRFFTDLVSKLVRALDLAL